MPADEHWRALCRLGLEQDVMTRIKYRFAHVDKPVLEEVSCRPFATMAKYRAWGESNLPEYLGYGRAADGEQ
jgi:hypothetical protein